MKKEFNIIKPNLYVLENEVYFSAETKEILKISRDVDKVVKEHIGQLKIEEGNLKMAKGEGRQPWDDKFTIPFNEYLDILEKREKFSPISYGYASMFNLGYYIDASTAEKTGEVGERNFFKECLKDYSNKNLEKFKEDFPYIKIDKEETLKEMKNTYEKLNSKMPDYLAQFDIIPGIFVHDEENPVKIIGCVNFWQVKSEDKKKIETAKKDLIEKLKEYDGPCLSLDAPELHSQMWRLYNYDNATTLIGKYGDIIKDPLWQTKFFKLDP